MQISEEAMIDKKPASVLGGVVIIAGSAIGAGMFSLPIISSGMWFGWSLLCMLLSWFCMYCASLMILEVNLNFCPGDSFDTLVSQTLGKWWNVVNGLLLAFLLYVLDYAYISGGGSIVNHTLQSVLGFESPGMLAGLMFVLSLGFVIWLSTKAVDRVVTILIVAMLISFFMVYADLSSTVEIKRLFDTGNTVGGIPHYYFLFAAVPYFMASFGFHAMVPSLVKYYGKKPLLIRKGMLTGSALCFVIYLLWLIGTMGNMPRETFLPIIAEGGNIGVLVKAINQLVDRDGLARLLNLFANMAIVSSFLGVSLALFDFIADKFKFSDRPLGRLKTAVVAFMPPAIGGLFFPNGFIYAIGFAGLALSVSALIIPALMVQKSRKKFAATGYRLWGGSGLVYFIVATGIFCATCHTFAMLELLPVYGK